MNMEPVKVIPCLDMMNGRIVKGVHFRDMVDAGDPAECIARYCEEGADEIWMLDIKASRSTQGVQAMVLRGKHTITHACRMEDAGLSDNGRYRCRSIPSIGALLTDEDLPEKQIKFE